MHAFNNWMGRCINDVTPSLTYWIYCVTTLMGVFFGPCVELIDSLMRKRRNSFAYTLELRFFCRITKI